MPEVTQDMIDRASAPTLTAEFINNLAAADQYKSVIRSIRVQRRTLAQILTAKVKQVQSLVDARQELVDQFRSQVLSAYPERASDDLMDLVASLGADHPIMQLWMSYSDKVNQIRAVIIERINEINPMMVSASNLEDAEQRGLDEYAQFVNAATTEVPSADELIDSLVTIDVMPSTNDQAMLMASIPGIEMLDPAAAAMVTEQAVTMAETGVDLTMAQQDSITGAAYSAPQASVKIPQGVKLGGFALLLYWLLGSN